METIPKINTAKSQFFEKINKIGKPLSRLIKKPREKNQINKIRNENREIITDNTEIQRIMRDYNQQLHANKMDNLEEMDTFLEKYSLKPFQEEIGNLNRPITSMEIKSVSKIYPKTKAQLQMISQVNLFREIQRIQRRVNTYLTQDLPENCRGR